MKILIVGGGIGGLAAAGFLEQKGFDVTLVERAPKFGHMGFGLSIWDETESLLKKLGVSETVRNAGYVLPWVDFRDKHGGSIDFRNYNNTIDVPPVMIERPVLLDVMVKSLRTTKLLLETTIKTLKNGKDRVEIELSNGTRETYDLVIAADGINSEIRERIFGQGRKRFYGWSVRSFWVPDHLLKLEGAIIVSKERVGAGVFPLKDRYFIVIYEYNPDRTKRPLSVSDDVWAAFGWDKDLAREITKEAREGREFYDHLSYIMPGNCYKGKIVLIGDAGHGFSPVNGMGANMAIEDGYVLAEELAQTVSQAGNLDLALLNFAKRRSARLKSVTFKNRYTEQLLFLTSPFSIHVRNVLSRALPIQWIRRTFKRLQRDEI